MSNDHETKSGVERRLVRRLQRATGRKYTEALRILEKIESHEDRVLYVKRVEERYQEQDE